jgi:hypothetical protein
LNVKSKGTFTAFITFPEYLAEEYLNEIDISTRQCNGAPAQRAKLKGHSLSVHFNTENLKETVTGNWVELTVKGEFGKNYNYGAMTFQGTDQVKTINPRLR